VAEPEVSATTSEGPLLSDGSASSTEVEEEIVLSPQALGLLSMLEGPEEKGKEWPKIAGPQKTGRVCVVGAGPAGVHMALRLKEKGYTKVDLLEKTFRVGGKCEDITHGGVPNPLGAIFAVASYFDNLIPLAEKYGLGEVVSIPSQTVWATNSASDPGSKLSTAAFVLSTLSQITNSSSPEVNLRALTEAAVRYVVLHQELFGTYEGYLMKKPSVEIMDRTRGTFLEFLTREDLLPLMPVFLCAFTVQGHGYLDEVSAIYGLIWNTPKFVVNILLRILKQDKHPYSAYTLKQGFEKVWTTVVKEEGLKVTFNVDIVGISRSTNGTHLDIWRNSRIETETCGFLIWTPPMADLLRVLRDPSFEEQRLFSTLQPEYFTASLIDTRNGVRHSPYTSYMEQWTTRPEHGVLVDIDFSGLLTPGIRTPEGVAGYNNLEGLQTRSTLQIGKTKSSEEELKAILKEHYMNGFDAKTMEILNMKTWTYFPRWSPEDASNGSHWDVFNMQGVHGMWYAGSSVIFESVPAVMEYNELLLRQMED
jgi:hypothetical protein